MGFLDEELIPYFRTQWPYLLPIIPILFYIIPYYTTNRYIGNVPGPFVAAFSNLWLLYHSRFAQRSLAVHAAHMTYGPLLRISPNHVSVADDQAIPAIYGHGNGFTKADFYDAFVSIHRGLFNTRDRAEHTRKRKMVSNTFAANSIRQFEPYMAENLRQFVKQWDRICENGLKTKAKWGEMDALTWLNYLAFDIIGDLAFGAPFGMLERGADVAEVRSSPDAKPRYAKAVEVLNRRGEVSATVGCFPAMKPFAKYLPDPFFSKGMRAIEDLAGIAVARVRARLDAKDANEESAQRQDLLARLMEGKDDEGNPISREELTAEALTQLIAGSDTTSNTSCALLFHVLAEPSGTVQQKLQKELDQAIPDGMDVPSYELVKDCTYLDAVIKEAMRIHSTSSMGLPRVVPKGKWVRVHDEMFPPGTVLSVPSYTIHRLKHIWGDDAHVYNPDRWSSDRLTERQKAAFIPFSYGPRSCVGRNVAEMEMALIVATMFRRYDFVLRMEPKEWRTREGFLRKPESLKVAIRRR